MDIFGIVFEMRKERVWMVQTEQQYICIHQVGRQDEGRIVEEEKEEKLEQEKYRNGQKEQ